MVLWKLEKTFHLKLLKTRWGQTMHDMVSQVKSSHPVLVLYFDWTWSIACSATCVPLHAQHDLSWVHKCHNTTTVVHTQYNPGETRLNVGHSYMMKLVPDLIGETPNPTPWNIIRLCVLAAHRMRLVGPRSSWLPAGCGPILIDAEPNYHKQSTTSSQWLFHRNTGCRPK